MTTWIRRSFQATGLTQYPVGRHLKAVQRLLGGSVVLCIDVSGSMSGNPLAMAVKGAQKFTHEAFEAGYDVGIVLWDDAVRASTAPQRDAKRILGVLGSARGGGGTSLYPALKAADGMLGSLKGDRVVAIFGDGGISDHARALKQALDMRARDIRIITCGLGDGVARSLDEFSSETLDQPRTATPETIEDSVANMSAGLRPRS